MIRQRKGNSHSNYTASCTDPLPEFGTTQAVHSTHQRVLNARLACHLIALVYNRACYMLQASRVIIIN